MVPARFVFICKIVAAPSVAPLGEPLQEYLWNFRKYRGRRGRKRDFPDAERLVKRLVARELTLSFVPDAEQRLWRTVTRKKYQLRCDRNTAAEPIGVSSGRGTSQVVQSRVRSAGPQCAADAEGDR